MNFLHLRPFILRKSASRRTFLSAIQILMGVSILFPGATTDATEPARPFWDSFPRIVETTRLQTALEHHATIGFNAAQNDPGWGLYGQRIGSKPGKITKFHEAGLKTISYFETFGQSYCYVGELSEKKAEDYTHLVTGHWSWQRYTGGPITWVGAHQYFDDDPVARPYTRTHHRYGAPVATYPDGTIATGFIGSVTDPRNSRTIYAICSKDILGNLTYETYYNEKVNEIDPETGNPLGPIEGLPFIPESEKYASMFMFKKDSACPAWIDYTRASTLMAADQGIDGMWTDNFSPWDSFGHRPVMMAFGEWSVARFRDYLLKEFSEDQLKTMGVQGLETFDVRKALMAIAKNWGWDGKDLESAIWRDPRWLEEPLWRAFLIFKRRTGTEALEEYYRTVKTTAKEGGREEFLVAGNDIPGFSLGWPRGELDMVSTEVTPGWGLARGSRGFRLPPFGRYAPFYKLGREHAQSRFVNIWFYNDKFEQELSNQTMISTLYYEMLANHTLPMFHPSNDRVVGTPESNAEFFKFVSRVAPEYGDRVPVEEIGLYYSSSSVLSKFTPAGIKRFDNQPHQFAFWGWATALGELHYQYRAIPEWKLTKETLNDLRVLILPDSEILDPDMVDEVLLPWVRDEGGLLLVTANTGSRFGESTNFELNPQEFCVSPLTGVEHTEVALDKNLNPIGDGKVLYLKSPIGFDFYMAKDQTERIAKLPTFQACINNLLMDSEPLAVEVSEGRSSNVGVTLYQSKSSRKLFLDLNNYGVNPSGESMVETGTTKVFIQLPESLHDKKFIARAVAPDSTPEVSVRPTSIDRMFLTVGPINHYASVILSPKN